MENIANMELCKFLLNDDHTVFALDENNQKGFCTYKSFYQSACAIAGFFYKNGLRKGDRLIVIMDNSFNLAKIYFACLYAGITVIPVNPLWGKVQLDFVIENSEAEFILISENYNSFRSPEKKNFIIVEDERKLAEDEYFFAEIECHESINPHDFLHPDNIAIIVYTSGTTSHPKGVVHSVGNLVQNGCLFIHTMGITAQHRFYNYLPMTYLGGYYNLLLIPYLARASVVITKTFDAKSTFLFWDNIIKNEINTIWFVPTIMAILMETDRSAAAKQYCEKNIILALVGTAPLTLKLKQDFEKKFGVTVYENFGLSESLFITTHLPNKKNQGVGRVLNSISVKIINNKNESCAIREEGEILITSPYVMNQYVNDAEGFNKKNDTWFCSGDYGFFDEDQNLHITGRKKDLIIKGGINISPAAIEALIYTHPEVKECAVVGIPDELSGEEIIVVLKLYANATFEIVKNQLLDLCKNSLPNFQWPKNFIEIEALPHTFTGKIQKAKLRSWLSGKIDQLTVSNKIPCPIDNHYFKASHVVSNCSPALSITYNTQVYELQSKNIDVTVLSLGEAFFDLPLYDFKDLPHPASYHYSHSRGIPVLRETLAQYFQDQYDVKFDPDNEIIITTGSKIAIYMALLALINPGDEVIIHEPAWVSYPEQVKLCQDVPVQVPYYESVYEFEKYITNRTKVLIVNNPNNPRGSLLTLDEIAHLYELAQKYHLYILSDEAYSDFILNKEEFISIGNFDKTFKFSIICNSISKNFGISGWRIGYIVSNQLLINQILKLNQHLITCPATILSYYIAQHFYDILKLTKPQITELLNKRQAIVNYLHSIGLSCLEGTTTFYLFLSIGNSKLNSDAFCQQLLNKYRICVVPGIGYGKSCDQFVRVSIGTESIEKIFKALDEIKKLIDETSEINSLQSICSRPKPLMVSV